MRARARAALGGALGAAGVLAFAGPSVLAIPDVRRRGAPRIAGLGRRDHVALTFDDGPDPESTPGFVEALRSLGWRATFFMLGEMVERAPALAAEVIAAGHELALHGYAHRSHLVRSPRDVVDDLARAADVLGAATGCSPRWMRPPLGHVATASVVGAWRLGLPLVLWSAWGRDWRATATAGSVVADIARSAGPGREGGATVLLHDSDCTSDPGCWRATLDALPRLAERWAGQGLDVGPLADHGVA